MEISFNISEDRAPEVLALVAASLVPAVVHQSYEHLRLTGKAPTESDMDRYRYIAFEHWAKILSLINAEISVKPKPDAGASGQPGSLGSSH